MGGKVVEIGRLDALKGSTSLQTHVRAMAQSEGHAGLHHHQAAAASTRMCR
jgi:hypothetical protein